MRTSNIKSKIGREMRQVGNMISTAQYGYTPTSTQLLSPIFLVFLHTHSYSPVFVLRKGNSNLTQILVINYQCILMPLLIQASSSNKLKLSTCRQYSVQLVMQQCFSQGPSNHNDNLYYLPSSHESLSPVTSLALVLG